MSRPLRWTQHSDLAINRRPTVDRVEFLDHLTFQANRRPLFTEIFGPIIGLKEEWFDQGATPEELDFSAFTYRCESRAHVPVSTGWRGGSTETLEETAEHLIQRDARGRTMKLIKGYATLALPLDWPVRTMDDWLKIKPHYEFTEERFGQDWEAVARRHLEAGRVLCVGIPGGFDEPRQLLGEEATCLAFYDQPELIADILQTIGDTAAKVLDRVSATVPIDLLSVHEDMAGKSGPLIGPKLIREFVKPYYRRVWDLLESRGARLFDQDSDGDMRPVIEPFIEAGVNLMHPLEPAAGMDIVKLRAEYGTRLAFYGGLDKHVLRQGHDAIDAELEYKLPPLVKSGGIVFGLDHRIPNGTPLEAYRYYLQKAWEILEREGAKLGG